MAHRSVTVMGGGRTCPPSSAPPEDVKPQIYRVRGLPVIQLNDKDTGALIGPITEEQLQVLIDELEEESGDDQDYYIDGDTIDMLEEAGADKGLVSLLRRALTGRTEMEIRWSRS
jgi:hypothetical protein